MKSEVRVRPAGKDDAGFLAEMLREAAAWRPEDARSLPEVLADPRAAVYVEGWGRVGDLPALSLSVERGNPPARLYERAGFRRVGRDGDP